MKENGRMEPGSGDADIGALANQIVRLRQELAAAEASAERANAQAKEAGARLKAANRALLEALHGPRKAKAPASAAEAASGPRWPLPARAKSMRAILEELRQIDVPMTRAELSKALPQLSGGALDQALRKLHAEAMVERLRDGSYALTEAQARAMREYADATD